MTTLEEQKLQVEIDRISAETKKFEAETLSLRKPLILKPSAWIPILAGIAALVASVGQLVKTNNELDIAKEEEKQLESYSEGLQVKLDKIGGEFESKLKTALEISLQKIPNSATDSQNIARITQGVAQTIAEQTVETLRLPDKVVIHFRGSISREIITSLQNEFNSKGMPAPRPERIAANYGNSIRYYHPDDSSIAKNIAQITREYFNTINCPLKIAPKFLSGYESEVKIGVIEIWVHHSCK